MFILKILKNLFYTLERLKNTMIGYKPYLFDAFYRWCSAASQTPVLEFDQKNCILPPNSIQMVDSKKEKSKSDTLRSVPSSLKSSESNQSTSNQSTSNQSTSRPIEVQMMRLHLSNKFCRNLRMSEEGVHFWIIPKGSSEPFEVFVPVSSWIYIEAKETGRLQPLDFEEAESIPVLPVKPVLKLVTADGRII